MCILELPGEDCNLNRKKYISQATNIYLLKKAILSSSYKTLTDADSLTCPNPSPDIQYFKCGSYTSSMIAVAGRRIIML